jgi:hypothetical protein
VGHSSKAARLSIALALVYVAGCASNSNSSTVSSPSPAAVAAGPAAADNRPIAPASGSDDRSITPPAAAEDRRVAPPVATDEHSATPPAATDTNVMMQFGMNRQGGVRAHARTVDASLISIHVSTSPAADPGTPASLPTSSGAVDATLTNSKGQHAGTLVENEPRELTIPHSGVIVEELTDEDPNDASLPDLSPTVHEIEVLLPAADTYTLRVKGFERGTYDIESFGAGPNSEAAGGLLLRTVPAHEGSLLELHFVCQREPSFEFDVESGGLQPPNGAFSFGQPLSSEVQMAPEDQGLSVVIFYDPVMVASTFRAFVDGGDKSSLFHVKLGEVELVTVPLSAGDHHVTIRAQNKSGLTTEQDFHVRH